jgi:hypothetical protein
MMIVRCAAAMWFRGRAGLDLAFRRGLLIRGVSEEGGAGDAGASRSDVSGALSAAAEAGAVSAIASLATSVAAASSSGVSWDVVAVRRTSASLCRLASVDRVEVGVKSEAVGRNTKAGPGRSPVMLA